MMDVIRETGEMGLYALADETYKQVKGIVSRDGVRDMAKAVVEGLPDVALIEVKAGRYLVRYEGVQK